jgi:hypothetical protein
LISFGFLTFEIQSSIAKDAPQVTQMSLDNAALLIRDHLRLVPSRKRADA